MFLQTSKSKYTPNNYRIRVARIGFLSVESGQVKHKGNLMGVQAIIFDYGNVLDHVDDPRPWLARRDAVAARFNMSGDAFWDLLYQTEPWQECKRGRMTYPVFWNAILSPLGLTDSAQQAKLVDELFEGRDHINAQMVQLLRELKPHYRLGVLSNTHDPHMAVRIRDQHGLKNVFDDVVSSAAVGL